jgi:hypothetical protein
MSILTPYDCQSEGVPWWFCPWGRNLRDIIFIIELGVFLHESAIQGIARTCEVRSFAPVFATRYTLRKPRPDTQIIQMRRQVWKYRWLRSTVRLALPTISYRLSTHLDKTWTTSDVKNRFAVSLKFAQNLYKYITITRALLAMLNTNILRAALKSSVHDTGLRCLLMTF